MRPRSGNGRLAAGMRAGDAGPALAVDAAIATGGATPCALADAAACAFARDGTSIATSGDTTAIASSTARITTDGRRRPRSRSGLGGLTGRRALGFMVAGATSECRRIQRAATLDR